MTSELMVLSAAGPLGRQWFAVARSADVQDAPAAVRLLRRDLVLWRSPSGAVVAAPDRCTHSKGDLTKGEVSDGRLVCPKHGWTFGDGGRCVFKPSGLPINDRAHLKIHPCTERYGLVWVSLDDPSVGVIDVAWDDDDDYRMIYSGVSVWQSDPIPAVERLLAQSDSPYVDVAAELPFSVRGTFKSDDGSEHRRLVSCAPVDSNTSLVASIVWTTVNGDDARIVGEAMADLGELKSITERAKGLPSAEITSDDEASSADWKRRLLAFIGQSST